MGVISLRVFFFVLSTLCCLWKGVALKGQFDAIIYDEEKKVTKWWPFSTFSQGELFWRIWPHVVRFIFSCVLQNTNNGICLPKVVNCEIWQNRGMVAKCLKSQENDREGHHTTFLQLAMIFANHPLSKQCGWGAAAIRTISSEADDIHSPFRWPSSTHLCLEEM